MRKKLLMFSLLIVAVAATASAQGVVRCESADGRYQECRIDGYGAITLTRQLSDSSCVEGKSWGVRDGRLWVDDGCRAEFARVAPVAMMFSTVACESINERRAQCAADTSGGVRLMQRMSESSCVFGREWGYDQNGIWVDKGCRAQFSVRGAAGMSTAALVNPRTLKCESKNDGRDHCDTDIRYGVALYRQISDAPCLLNRTWGVDPDGIWVTEGCRGEFAIGDTHVATASQSTIAVPVAVPVPVAVHASSSIPAGSMVCESVNEGRSHCRIDTRSGITLVQQISDSPCVLGKTWGVDADGIWVNGGCRGAFVRSGMNVPMTSAAPLVMQPSGMVCESINNGRSHCRIDTRSGISLTRQISDNVCVRDRTWGVDRDGVWVTDGCRAEFVMGDARGATVVTVPSVSQVPTLTCESLDGRRNHCRTETSLGVTLLRQISDSDCVLNQTWGVDRDGVWVSGGCRAEFTSGGGTPWFDTANAPKSARVLCESKDGKRNVCPADTRLGVAVVRQMSDSPCVLNSTWGFDTNGIWVTAGCRGEFIMRR